MLWLLERLGYARDDVCPVCLGDDLTDEDMFRRAKGWGIAIVVGSARPAHTARTTGSRTRRGREFLADFAVAEVSSGGRIRNGRCGGVGRHLTGEPTERGVHMVEFAIKDCALAHIATGRRAQTLRELRDILRDVHPGCIYHHFWGTLLRPQFSDREYNNDFAAWCHEQPSRQPRRRAPLGHRSGRLRRPGGVCARSSSTSSSRGWTRPS